MITVQNLTKRYGRATAVDNVSFHVARGEIVGFLGPNGAGKTTTMRILACFLPATGGTVEVAGFDAFAQSIEVRRRIGYLPEHFPVYTDMRVEEYLWYRGRIRELSGNRIRERLPQVMEDCGLEPVRRQVIGRLSKGYRHRVGLADALLHDPDVLILDEPTVGLDPNQIRHIREVIRNLRGRHTVLLSSHILPEVEMLCERVLILHHGRIVASDTPQHLIRRLKGGTQIVVEVNTTPARATPVLEAIPGVRRVTAEAVGTWTRLVCDVESGLDIRTDIFTRAVENNWMIRELFTESRHLEDVFVQLTAEESAS